MTAEFSAKHEEFLLQFRAFERFCGEHPEVIHQVVEKIFHDWLKSKQAWLNYSNFKLPSLFGPKMEEYLAKPTIRDISKDSQVKVNLFFHFLDQINSVGLWDELLNAYGQAEGMEKKKDLIKAVSTMSRKPLPLTVSSAAEIIAANNAYFFVSSFNFVGLLSLLGQDVERTFFLASAQVKTEFPFVHRYNVEMLSTFPALEALRKEHPDWKPVTDVSELLTRLESLLGETVKPSGAHSTHYFDTLQETQGFKHRGLKGECQAVNLSRLLFLELSRFLHDPANRQQLADILKK